MKHIKIFLLIAFIFFVSGCSNLSGKDEIIFSGTVEATQVNIVSEIGSKIADIFFKEGDSVRKGDLLVQLDDTSLKLQRDSAKASVEMAKAQLDELLAGSRDESIKSAEASVKQAEAALNEAEKSLAYYKDLYAKNQELFLQGAVPEQKIIDLRQALDEAQSQYDKAKSLLDQAIAQRDLTVEGARSESIRAARASVSQAEDSLALAEETLKKASIYSPIDGVVLCKNFEIGESIFAGSNILTIQDPADLWVEVYIPEKLLGKIKLHQKLNVKFENRAYPGEITFISPQGEFTPRNVQEKSERENIVYKVKVKLTSKDLKPGMEVDVELPKGDAE
ncbi:MAG: HlyD family efflux transporter periplasmic adaptor subunit [Tepidanaerobacteraceae bacterium]|jgi:HlyD family secretion protein|nr:HlyD family efflux transporter periplasmic adaptor subunit [Tepidanaerobacteraceae bacterium]